MNAIWVPGEEVVYCLHDLPSHVGRAMNLSVHRGAALALTATQLRSSQELRFLRLRIPSRMTMEERESLARDFGGPTAHIISETDNTELLQQAGGVGWSGSGWLGGPGATEEVGWRGISGTFTNQLQTSFNEPRLRS